MPGLTVPIAAHPYQAKNKSQLKEQQDFAKEFSQ
jgi:hypothetical protein